jgi:hypothetical protein
MIALAALQQLASAGSLAAQQSSSSQSLEYQIALQRGTQIIWGLPT